MNEFELFKEVNQRTLTYVDRFIDTARPSSISYTSISTVSLPFFEKKTIGKVRDIYECKDVVILVTTDRVSAFDFVLANIPFKGQVLNLISLWWFNLTATIIPNHIIASPHPNVTIGRRCSIFSVEFVVRGYITGSTSTSMWTNYNKGVRNYCGHSLPEGLVKNQKLEENKVTPTTKDALHDALISRDEIISTGLMTQEDFDFCSNAALRLFEFGQRMLSSKGMILVDTKYEFGKDANGNILLVD
jgi:phosphoribosylaminoimidazole-succinocarboxamide synthase